MSRWHHGGHGQRPQLLRKRRRKGGVLRSLYEDIGLMPAEEAQKAVERGPSPTALWFETQVAADEAAEHEHRVRHGIPEVSRAAQANRDEAAQAAAEQAELRRAAQAAHRRQADLDHADNVARLVQRKSELEAVKAFERRHIDGPRRLARFVQGGGR